MLNFFSKNKLFLFCLAGWLLFFSASSVLAASYELEVKLPGMTSDSVSDPGAYIRYLFIFGVSLAGFLAVGMIIYGGVKYMLAASVGNTQDAKDKILGALGGVALIMCSYLLLYTIDPSLTNLSPLPVSQIMASDVEAPSPPDSGLTEGATTPSGGEEIKCKTNKICQDIKDGKVNGTLVKSLSSLPVGVTVTETTGSHGCSSTDSCVAGAARGTSSHCGGNAADIRVSNLTTEQKKEVMQTLSQNKCVDQLFYSGFPEYCRAGGGQNASKSKSCSAHSDHIHYSVKSGCT